MMATGSQTMTDTPEHQHSGPVGVAVVGAGYWGPNLTRNFRSSTEWDLRWVVDLDLERAQDLVGGHAGERATTSLEEMLADPEVRAVAIATPPASHLPVGLACIEAGRHVLIEKPLATTHEDGLALVNAADAAGVVLMCDHTFCYTPVVERLRELVRSGELGDITYVDSIRVNLGLVQSDVDVIWDLAPHDLSILDFVLPDDVRPVAVSASGADPLATGQNCVGYLTIPLSTGAIAHVTSNWLSPTKIRQTVFAGAKKMAVWDDMKPYQRLAIVDKGIDVRHSADEDERRRLMVDYRTGDMVIPAINETSEALQKVVNHFVHCVRTGDTPLTDGRAGLRILAVLEAAATSIESNCQLVTLASD